LSALSLVSSTSCQPFTQLHNLQTLHNPLRATGDEQQAYNDNPRTTESLLLSFTPPPPLFTCLCGAFVHTAAPFVHTCIWMCGASLFHFTHKQTHASGLSCIDCYAYLAPEIQITLVWNEFYVTDFTASLRGSSVVNVGVGILDPAFLEIGKHFYEIYNEDNYTDAVDFGLFTLDSKKRMTFEVDGFGKAAGAGSITARAEAKGELTSRYKKFSGKVSPAEDAPLRRASCSQMARTGAPRSQIAATLH